MGEVNCGRSLEHAPLARPRRTGLPLAPLRCSVVPRSREWNLLGGRGEAGTSGPRQASFRRHTSPSSSPLHNCHSSPASTLDLRSTSQQSLLLAQDARTQGHHGSESALTSAADVPTIAA